MDMNRSQAAQSCKPAVSYGWDWHPRLVPLGIWDETYLEIKNNTHITDFFTQFRLNNDFSEFNISVMLEGTNLEGQYFECKLLDPNGKQVLSEKGNVSGRKALATTFKNPELWWPHDHGNQPLYISEIIIMNESGNTLRMPCGVVATNYLIPGRA